MIFGLKCKHGFSTAGGCKTKRDWAVLFALCPVFLALQTVSWLLFGLDGAKQIYPLYIHLAYFELQHYNIGML